MVTDPTATFAYVLRISITYKSDLKVKRFHPNFIVGCQSKLNGYLTVNCQLSTVN
jgi:hypothetical protein